MTSLDVAALRARFPILASTNHLVNHSLGAMPGEVRDELAAFADAWATRGVRAWGEGWWDSPVEVGDLLGEVVGAAPGTIAMLQNVSVATAVVASTLSYGDGRDGVVYTGGQFPSVMYVWRAQERHGARIVEVPLRDDGSPDTAAVLAAIDERTRIVPVSHVLFSAGWRQDLAAIVARAHEVGALVFADCYQSVGVVPFDLTALGVDMACGGSVKWLCGGPGAGWLYVAPHVADTLEPGFTGWAAHAEPFAFEPGAQRYASGAWRFLNGTPAVPALYAARAGYRFVRDVGVDAIAARNRMLTERLLARADERGLVTHSPRDPDRRGGSVTIDVPETAPMVAALAARDILVDGRPRVGLRIGPHVYNTEDEVDACVDAIAELLGSGAWRDHEGRRTG